MSYIHVDEDPTGSVQWSLMPFIYPPCRSVDTFAWFAPQSNSGR